MEEYIKNLLEENPHVKQLGIKLRTVSEEYTEGYIPLTEKLLNPMGTLHGGCLYSLADIVAGVAATCRGHFVTTVSGELNYMKPAVNTEYVTCKAYKIRFGKNLGVFRVELFNDKEELLDIGTFTYYDLGQPVRQ